MLADTFINIDWPGDITVRCPQCAAGILPAGSGGETSNFSRSQERTNVLEKNAVNDEAALLARIRNGAPDDFAEIIQQHQPLVFSILHRYERDSHLVEDMAQETFVKAWKA